MIMNSWKSIGASECAPAFRMFIIGTGKTLAFVAAEIAKQRKILGRGSGMRDRERNAKQCIRAQILFVRRAIELDHFVVDLGLVARVPAFDGRRNRAVHICHRFQYAFAAVTFLVAVAQFPGFVFARARAARHGGAAKRAAFQAHIDFEQSGCRANRESRARGSWKC